MIYQRLFKENITSKTQINEWINQINSDVKYLQGLLDKVVSQLEVCKKFLLVPFNKKQLPDLLKLDSLVKEFEKTMYDKSYYYNWESSYNFERKDNEVKNNFINLIQSTYKPDVRKERLTGLDKDLYFYLNAERYNWKYIITTNEERKLIGFRQYSDETNALNRYLIGKENFPKPNEPEKFKNHPYIDEWIKSINICSRNEINKFNQVKIIMKKGVQRLKSTGLFVDIKEMTILNIPVIIAVKDEKNKSLVDTTIANCEQIIESLDWFKPYSSSVKFIKILDDKKTLMSLFGRKGLVDTYAFYDIYKKEIYIPTIKELKEIHYLRGTIKHELFHHVFNQVFEKNETLFNQLKDKVLQLVKNNKFPSDYAKSYFKNPTLAKRGVKTQVNEYCAEVMSDIDPMFEYFKKSITGMI